MGGLDSVSEGPLRVVRKLGEGGCLKRAGAGLPGRAARMRAFRERVHGDGRHHGERKQGNGSDDRKAPLARVGLLAVALQLAPGPPGEDAVCQDIVEDLVALARSGPVDGAHDALAAESLEHRPHLRLPHGCVLGKVARPVGDLRPGRRDELAEHRRRDVLLRRLQPTQRPLEMFPDDRLGAAELPKRGQAQNVRAALALGFPEPLEHELEVGRFDALNVCLDAAPACPADVDPARGHLVEHGLDQLGLGSHARARELVVVLDGPEDCCPSARAVEVVEAQVVRKEVRDPPLEGIELRERVLPQAEQEVRAQPGLADRGRELAGERVLLVVEEVLLELVEDDIDVPAHDLRRRSEPFRQRSGRLDADRLVDRSTEAGSRVACPGREDDHGRVVRSP